MSIFFYRNEKKTCWVIALVRSMTFIGKIMLVPQCSCHKYFAKQCTNYYMYTSISYHLENRIDAHTHINNFLHCCFNLFANKDTIFSILILRGHFFLVPLKLTLSALFATFLLVFYFPNANYTSFGLFFF